MNRKYSAPKNIHIIVSTFLFLLLCFPSAVSYWYAYDPNFHHPAGSLLIVLSLLFSAIPFVNRLHIHHIFRMMIASLIILFIYFFDVLQSISFYLQGTGFNQSFFFHFTLNTVVNTWKSHLYAIAFFSASIIAIILMVHLLCKKNMLKEFPKKYLVISVMPLIFIDSSAEQFFETLYRMNSPAELSSPKTDSRSLLKMGLNPESLSPPPLKSRTGKNLVYIYMESIEKIHTENEIFPGLTPEIQKLMKKGIVFDMDQYPGTGWTVGGIVSSQCGTPVISYRRIATGNDIMRYGFLQNAVCMGDVLKNAGYAQTFLGGANRRFGGKYDFLIHHGYDEVYGFFELKHKLRDKSYRNTWGLNDDTLLEIAVEEYNKKAETEKPFNLTLLTLNTHEGDGVMSKSCRPYKTIAGNGMIDTIHCTDQLIGRFINEISKSPAFPNTVVVLMGDHLGWRNSAMELYPKDYDRKIFAIILNSTRLTLCRDFASHMDMAPTVLDAMGVEHNSRFLCGTSMFDTEKSSEEPLSADAEVKDTIGYVNSNFFSTQSEFPLEDDVLHIQVGENHIQFSDTTVHLYRNGLKKRKDVLNNEYGLVLLIDDQAKILHQALLNNIEITKPVFSTLSKDYIFFMIAPNSMLPCWMSEKHGKEGIGVYAGKFPHIVSLKNVEKIDELSGKEISLPQNLRSLFDRTTDFSKNDFFSNFNRCCQDSRRYAVHGNREILLPHFKMGEKIYRIHLKQKDLNVYTLDNYEETEVPDSDDYSCAGILTQNYLFLPVIYPDNRTVMHRMELIQKNDQISLHVQETYPLNQIQHAKAPKIMD